MHDTEISKPKKAFTRKRLFGRRRTWGGPKSTREGVEKRGKGESKIGGEVIFLL